VVRGFDQPIELDRFREGEAPAEPQGGRTIASSHSARQEPRPPGITILNKPFDAAICMGNSLALAPDAETVERAIRQMFAAVRPGGIVIVQVLNLWQLPDGPCVWQKCKKANLSFSPEPTATALTGDSAIGENLATDVLLLKGVHRSASRGYVEFLATSLAEGKLLHHESVTFLGLEATQLEQSARTAGAKTIHFFGDYHQHSYKPAISPDLMMVTEK
jgi:hypothetical protein